MDEARGYEAQFEALGEVEVYDRVERRFYEGAARAYAMRWLNDKAMARLTGASFLAAPVAAELAALARHSRRSGRWAAISAGVAGVATVANIGFVAYAQIQAHKEASRHDAEVAALAQQRLTAQTQSRRAAEARLGASSATSPNDRPSPIAIR
ncbi:hypothetical protein ACO2Q3_25670 [Caulobacter sp. KR2-114]|uniref:hypothetical protein n=1 Tax=Caulobacter sp. KR2-114 TaxID=3400912 RepID=UPI003BFF00A9